MAEDTLRTGTPYEASGLTEFRNRGVSVVVDTTQHAELDFAHCAIFQEDQERVARNLKNVIRSNRDRIEGYLRAREVIQGWEVIFTHYTDNAHYVVLIIGYAKKGEVESAIEVILRAGLEQYAPGIRALLQGKQPK